MEVQQDFRELLELFNAHKVEYLIVGAYALALHGAPRFTGDLDILIKPEEGNALRIIAALDKFGFSSLNLSTTDLEKPDTIIQLGIPPVRIDIITSLTAVSWDEAFRGKVEGLLGDVCVYYLGRDQYVTNKKAIGRNKDMADLEALGED
ncbi:MAG: hypothetical protein CO189_11065 [candidate division Zixibacteria bacterium CG_4_9_14_3_um_filter_46_8]|nr:MAG: hypothetical protein CO189_11065 [candidate division Zixibacteria bacterium CG_4_9_14_3_um_filter_46_8]